MSMASLGEIRSSHRAYRQLFELGRGGMARVYLAESLASGIRKLVVLKVLNAELSASAEMRLLFRREAELAAQMNHPNVVQVMEVLEYFGSPAIVMEYLEGVPLSLLRLQGHGALPLPLHMYVLSQVLAGLHHFHELRDLEGAPLNTVHRDVSPQNVMVLHEGIVKVLDFGIAKVNASTDQVTRTGTLRGKIHYMAPEQVLGERIDRRADLFAAGVMLWQAVAGRHMWQGKSDAEVLRTLPSGPLPRLPDMSPAVPAAVRQIVERATHVDREQRYATAQEMQGAIEHALADQGWLIRHRDLSDFMAQNFGEIRRVQQLRTKSALRTSVNTAGVTAPSAVAPPAPGVPSRRNPSGNPTLEITRRSVSRVLRTGRRTWKAALAALAGIGLLWVVWIVMKNRTPPRHAPGLARPETVLLAVEAAPVGADIFVDGKPLGRSPLRAQQPWSDRVAVVTVEAPGYLTESREVTLEKDFALEVVLKPHPGVDLDIARTPVPSASKPVAGASSRPVARPPAVSRVTPRPPRPPASPAAKNCHPPYWYTTDGIKTYKPECF